jgi:Tol biopolymer transport system component
MLGPELPYRLGPYELDAIIGAGGMGEVYRARDTRLDRTVAIKIVKREFSDRFEREARAISALNHPHICTLYDVGSDGDTSYLVMEHIEGRHLACPMGMAQALDLGVQIADALAAAHRQGIIHRDLKPGNILITREGVKLLDFGLARVQSQVSALDQGTTANLTIAGTVLGTLRYMAPEQLEGREADARTDIHAFGLVLYEMLTGRRAYEASSSAGVISAIMTAPVPSIRTHRQELPQELERVIDRCLAKDPHRRWQSAEALSDALQWLRDSSSSRVTQQVVPVRRQEFLRGWRIPAALALAGGACLAIGWWAATGVARTAAPAVRMITDLGLPPDLPAGFDTMFVIAPDGRSVVFNSAKALWLRSLENATLQRLPGTTGGTMPFWSPDSRSIGFFADGRLERLAVPDGSPVVLAPAPNPRGGAWSARGVIVFAPESGGALLQIREDGGAPEPVTALDAAREEVTHQFPSFLSDGSRFVFFAGSRQANRSSVRIASLGGPAASAPLVAAQPFQSAASVAETPDGAFLLHVRDRELVAQAFDARRGLVTGPVRTLARRVRERFSVAANGTIIYSNDPPLRNQPTWLDREGRPIGSAGDVGAYSTLAISRDQATVAYARATEAGGVRSLWLRTLASGAETKLPVDGSPDDPVWSPDGRRLACALKLQGTAESNVYILDLAQPDRPRPLLTAGPERWPVDWSPDGRFILYVEVAKDTKYDLWIAAADGGGAPTPVVRGPGKDQSARFSPDGRYISYQSDESGVTRIYITNATGDVRQTVIASTGEANRGRWRGDGRELYYSTPTQQVVAVPIREGASGLEPGTPRTLFTATGRFEPAAPGDRFLVLQQAESQASAVHVLTGWQREAR